MEKTTAELRSITDEESKKCSKSGRGAGKNVCTCKKSILKEIK